MTSRVHLEEMLSSRGFGATLPTPFPAADEIPTPERLLRQGAPAGRIVELIPDPEVAGSAFSSAGSLACHLAARVTGRARGGRVAWLDPNNRFDPLSAHRAGVNLDQLLWVRGEERWMPQMPAGDVPASGERMTRLIRFFEALYLLVHCGDFDLLVLDLGAWPKSDLRQVQRSDWLRLLRAVERMRRTAVVILAPAPLATSCGSWAIGVSREGSRWRRNGRPWLEGLLLQARSLTSRRSEQYSVRTTHPLRIPLELRP